jgi:protein-tyrosine-phosphatase
MAEAIARQDAWDVIIPLSAGVAALGFVAETTTKTLAASGYTTNELRSKPLTEELWDAAHVVINMTGQPGESLFRAFLNPKTVEDWLVLDPYGQSGAAFQKVCEELQQRVADLAERLRRQGKSVENPFSKR